MVWNIVWNDCNINCDILIYGINLKVRMHYDSCVTHDNTDYTSACYEQVQQKLKCDMWFTHHHYKKFCR